MSETRSYNEILHLFNTLKPEVVDIKGSVARTMKNRRHAGETGMAFTRLQGKLDDTYKFLTHARDNPPDQSFDHQLSRDSEIYSTIESRMEKIEVSQEIINYIKRPPGSDLTREGKEAGTSHQKQSQPVPERAK